MDNFCMENWEEILEIAQAMCMRLSSNPESARKTLDMWGNMVDKIGLDPFDGGRFIHRTSDERHSMIHLPQPNGIINPLLCKTRDAINADIQADAIVREKRKSIRKKSYSVSGLLPNSEKISCLWHMAEGERLDGSLTSPTHEGGHLYLLLLEACNLDFAIDDEVIKDVGIPPTLFLIRTEKSTKTTEINGKIITEETVKVTRTYARCLNQSGYINGLVMTYDWPWSNCSVGSNGWLCLGGNYQSGSLVFPDIQSLASVPKLIISHFPTTSHYGPSFADEVNMTYSILAKYMKENQGKPFNINHLKQREPLGVWLERAINDMYR